MADWVCRRFNTFGAISTLMQEALMWRGWFEKLSTEEKVRQSARFLDMFQCIDLPRLRCLVSEIQTLCDSMRTCLLENIMARRIQRAYRAARANPYTEIGRRRLQQEFESMECVMPIHKLSDT
jgi:hypothetical protein